ncbi:MAG: type II toxin-antitoxin system VapC family toxin [Mycobacteriales bacterium]
MSDYVVDAAAAVDALSGKGAVSIALRARITRSTCHAPHLIDAEVGHALRRGARRDEIDQEEARTALHALPNIINHRYPQTPDLSERAWALRHTMSFYDALYVALATVLDLSLLTGDVKLSKAPGITCQVELIS